MSNGSEAIFMPTMSVYDTNMMAAYINAVKGEYERSLEDYDKFVSKYGDFTSPILKDVEYWNNNTFDQFDRTYDELVAAGIDPLRTKEGQAIMRRAARNIPYAELAKRKQNAKDAEKYNEVVRQLKLLNKFDEEFADWQFRRTHGGVSMRNWDSSMGDGIFGADVPSPYQSMQEATKGWYEGLQNGYLGTQNGYDYFGKSPDAVRAVIAAQAPNLTSEYWLYLKDRIRSVLGPNASEEAVNSALQSVLFDSARNVYSVQDPTTGEWSNATREENAASKREQELKNTIRANSAKAATDFAYDMARLGVDVNDPQQMLEYQRQMRESRDAKNNKESGSDSEISGGYASVINDAASAAKRAQEMRAMMSPSLNNEYNAALKIQDPVKRQQALNKVGEKAFTHYMTMSRPGGSIYKRLMKAGPGEDGRKEINGILDLRAVSGHRLLDETAILGSDLEKDSDGWFSLEGSGYRVVSSHRLMANILRVEGNATDNRDGIAIPLKNGEKTTTKQIIEHLLDAGEDYTHWWYASEELRAYRATKIKPSTSKKRYIVGYDEDGNRKLYMKAKAKQGAALSPWSHTEEDVWVELPIDLLPDGSPSLESVPNMYGSEVVERKTYGNAGITSAYGNARF